MAVRLVEQRDDLERAWNAADDDSEEDFSSNDVFG
jgi:hypothetical protein